jgi:hypothetical protein
MPFQGGKRRGRADLVIELWQKDKVELDIEKSRESYYATTGWDGRQQVRKETKAQDYHSGLSRV